MKVTPLIELLRKITFMKRFAFYICVNPFLGNEAGFFRKCLEFADRKSGG
jgi:hypothetical protein